MFFCCIFLTQFSYSGKVVLSDDKRFVIMERKDNFFFKVYEITKQIPCGKVATYGQIAKMLGRPNMARQVGFALHANPMQSEIPCHRVVNRFGRVAAGFAFGGEEIQMQMLKAEKIEFENDDYIDLVKFGWNMK